MSGSDGMDSSTEVPTISCVWVLAALSYHVRHLMSLLLEDPAPVALPGIEKPPGMFQIGSPGGSTVGRQVVKSCPTAFIVMR
jgi:hypothetical protein